MLQSYPCPVCSGDKNERLYKINDFNIVRCHSCSMVFVNPRLRNEQVYDLYKENYFNSKDREHGYENYELAEHLRNKTFLRWYDEIERKLLVKPGNALDAGCASGDFLRILVQNDWRVNGIELDRDMFEKVKNQGFDVSDTPLEHYESSTKFHLITLFDVLEHLPYLKKDINKLSELLDDEGSIVFVTPDFSSRQRKLLGKRWFQFKPKEHIYYFSPKTLDQTVKQCGLKIVYLSSSGQYADLGFIHNRLKRYGFMIPAFLLKMFMKITGWENKSWYTQTGSMLVILQKQQ